MRAAIAEAKWVVRVIDMDECELGGLRLLHI